MTSMVDTVEEQLPYHSQVKSLSPATPVSTEREKIQKAEIFMAVMVDKVEEQLQYHPWVKGLSLATPVLTVREKIAIFLNFFVANSGSTVKEHLPRHPKV